MVAINQTNRDQSSNHFLCSWVVRRIWPPHKKLLGLTVIILVFIIKLELSIPGKLELSIPGWDQQQSSTSQKQEEQQQGQGHQQGQGQGQGQLRVQEQQQGQNTQQQEQISSTVTPSLTTVADEVGAQEVERVEEIVQAQNKHDGIIVDNDVKEDPNALLKFDHDWKPSIHGEITLIISDLAFETSKIINFLDNDIPDFIHETVVVVPPGTEMNELDTKYYLESNNNSYNSNHKKVRIVHRGLAKQNQDICSVVISTKYFMTSKSWQPTLIPRVPLFTTSDKDNNNNNNSNIKILVPMVNTDQCRNNPYCSVDLDASLPFDDDPQAFESSDFLYLTEMRNEYCKRYVPVFKDFRFQNVNFSPTSYMAFLKSMGVANKYYKVVRNDSYKCRPTLTPTTPALRQGYLNDSLCETDNNQDDGNSNACPLHATNVECVTIPNCVYRPLNNCPPSPLQNYNKWEHEGIPHRDEMIEIIQNAHNYWLDPSSFEVNTNAVVSAKIPQKPTVGRAVPDKIFACYDIYEHFHYLTYFEGPIFMLNVKGWLFSSEAQISEENQARRKENLDFVQKHATEQSLLLGNVMFLHDCLPDYITDFPGQQLFRNIEPKDFTFLTPNEKLLYPEFASRRNLPPHPDRYNYLPPSDKVYVLGCHEDSPTSVRVMYLAYSIAARSHELLQMLFDPTKKPVGTKEEFLLFSASHFVEFREKAVNQIAKIGTIHIAGSCQGTGIEDVSACVPYADDERPSNIQPSPHDVNKGQKGMTTNHELYKHYRFVLVMENINLPGYITEKLCNAFLSGAIPIWYGTKQVFEIFNEKAMIYYDIDNPQEALDRITYLEQNPEAYDAMTKEPILARNSNGEIDPESVIEKWFSLRDEIGNGKLKKRIFDMMGYRDFGSTAIFY